MPKTINLTGQQFGLLTVLYPTENRVRGNIIWMCSCKCGTKNVEVQTTHLLGGNTESCGCIANGHMRKLAIRSNQEYFLARRMKKICINEACEIEFETLSKKVLLCPKCTLKKRLGTRPSKDDW